MKKIVAGSLGFAALTLSVAASAQQWSAGYSTGTGGYASPFPTTSSSQIENVGNAGQWVFGAERVTSLSYNRQKLEADGGGELTNSSFDVNLFAVQSDAPSTMPRLALDYLVMDGLSVGGSLGIVNRATTLDTGSAESDASTFGFLISPRVGYAYPFNETWGVWPRLALNYMYASTTSDTDSGDVTTKNSLYGVTLDAMAVLSPFKHVALLGGPYIDYLMGSAETESGGASNDADANYLSIGLSFAVSVYY